MAQTQVNFTTLHLEILRERSRTRLVVKPALPAPANGSTVSTTFAHLSQEQ
ncbi:hypothetical protein GBAR_LOCUS13824 [Geodia barretti]|uniref:Uncharacterized protein n=1 Tax=Geodia barretti TaxID=519541 RepID=A0AA35WKG4_GEOBA|nr:hypothetical protein GBAR_LOCUS13824 [Geodia barretti]